MSRKFISGILATAIAVTGFSVSQAQASDRDVARFLAGATALVILGTALNNNQNKKVVRVVPGHHDKHWKQRQRARERAQAQARREARLEARQEARQRQHRRVHNGHKVAPRPLPERARNHQGYRN